MKSVVLARHLLNFWRFILGVVLLWAGVDVQCDALWRELAAEWERLEQEGELAPELIYRLGLLYDKGEELQGEERVCEKAVKYYRIAFENGGQGSTGACERLADLRYKDQCVTELHDWLCHGSDELCNSEEQLRFLVDQCRSAPRWPWDQVEVAVRPGKITRWPIPMLLGLPRKSDVRVRFKDYLVLDEKSDQREWIRIEKGAGGKGATLVVKWPAQQFEGYNAEVGFDGQGPMDSGQLEINLRVVESSSESELVVGVVRDEAFIEMEQWLKNRLEGNPRFKVISLEEGRQLLNKILGPDDFPLGIISAYAFAEAAVERQDSRIVKEIGIEAVLYDEIVHLLVAAANPVEDFEDLKGHSVLILGREGSRSRGVLKALFDVHEMEIVTEFGTDLDLAGALKRLTEDTEDSVDAVAWLGPMPMLGLEDAINDMGSSNEFRFLTMPRTLLNLPGLEVPGSRPVKIEAGVYGSLPRANIDTIGTSMLLVGYAFKPENKKCRKIKKIRDSVYFVPPWVSGYGRAIGEKFAHFTSISIGLDRQLGELDWTPGECVGFTR